MVMCTDPLNWLYDHSSDYFLNCPTDDDLKSYFFSWSWCWRQLGFDLGIIGGPSTLHCCPLTFAPFPNSVANSGLRVLVKYTTFIHTVGYFVVKPIYCVLFKVITFGIVTHHTSHWSHIHIHTWIFQSSHNYFPYFTQFHTIISLISACLLS